MGPVSVYGLGGRAVFAGQQDDFEEFEDLTRNVRLSIEQSRQQQQQQQQQFGQVNAVVFSEDTWKFENCMMFCSSLHLQVCCPDGCILDIEMVSDDWSSARARPDLNDDTLIYTLSHPNMRLIAPSLSEALLPCNFIYWLYQVLLPMSHDFKPECINVTIGHIGLVPAVRECLGLLVRSLQSTTTRLVYLTVLQNALTTTECLQSAVNLLTRLIDQAQYSLSPIKFTEATVSDWLLTATHRHIRDFGGCFHSCRFVPGCSKDDVQMCAHWPNYPCDPSQNDDSFGEESVNVPHRYVADSLVDDAGHVKRFEFESGDLAPKLSTTIAYDPAMALHADDEPHPECPQRITSIYEELCVQGLIPRCRVIGGTRANVDDLKRVHTEKYLTKIAKSSQMGVKARDELAESYNSIFLNEHSFDCALMAAGSVVQCVDDVLTGRTSNAFAVVRPPGHHAEAKKAYGFCLLDNVAVAARHALVKHKDVVKRVLIVDWDVHHGNGVQNAFIEDPNVVYMSLHRWDYGDFFPQSERNSYKDVGEGDGVGATFNFAWSERTMNDADYVQAFLRVLLPVAHSFQPDLVLVSCGFDAARGDPLGRYNLTPECYGWMTRQLMMLAHGRIVLALEGGYNLQSISRSAASCVRSLLGDDVAPMDDATGRHVYPGTYATLQRLIDAQKRYWPVVKALAHRYAAEEDSMSVSDSDRSVTPDQLFRGLTIGKQQPRQSNVVTAVTVRAATGDDSSTTTAFSTTTFATTTSATTTTTTTTTATTSATTTTTLATTTTTTTTTSATTTTTTTDPTVDTALDSLVDGLTSLSVNERTPPVRNSLPINKPPRRRSPRHHPPS